MYSGQFSYVSGSGFAFIFCEELGRKIFMHISEYRNAAYPVVGTKVEFNLGQGRKPGDQDVAVAVRPIFTPVENGASSLLAGGR